MPHDCNQTQTPSKYAAIPCSVCFQRNIHNSLDLWQTLRQHFDFTSFIPPFLHSRAPDVPHEQLKPRGSAVPAASAARLSATLRHVAHGPSTRWVMSRSTPYHKCVIKNGRGGKIMAFDDCTLLRKHQVKMVWKWSHLYLGGPNSMDSFLSSCCRCFTHPGSGSASISVLSQWPVPFLTSTIEKNSCQL